MRVIAGSARRMTLEVAEASPTRPFLEKARGALFNALADMVPEGVVLDLYAGSGALGIEALSRGAAHGTFVERDPAAVQVLANNLGNCGFTRRSRVVRGDAFLAAKRLAGPFDLIFVDPPFPDVADWGAKTETREFGGDLARLLADAGELVLRIEDDKAAPPDWPGLALHKEKRYGRSRICRYRRSGEIR